VSFRLQGPVEFPPPLERPDLERSKVYVTFPVFMDFSYAAVHLEAYAAALRIYLATELTANYYQFREIKFHRNRDDLEFMPKKIRSPKEVENTARHAGALVHEEGLMSIAICSPTICPDEWDDDYPGWAWMLTFVVPVSTALLVLVLCWMQGCCCFAAPEEEDEKEMEKKKLKEEVIKERKLLFKEVEDELGRFELKFRPGEDELCDKEDKKQMDSVLKAVADLIDQHPEIKVEIQGHTTVKDEAIGNKRAVHVYERLLQMGVHESRIETRDCTSTMLKTGYGPEHHSHNRVEFAAVKSHKLTNHCVKEVTDSACKVGAAQACNEWNTKHPQKPVTEEAVKMWKEYYETHSTYYAV